MIDRIIFGVSKTYQCKKKVNLCFYIIAIIVVAIKWSHRKHHIAVLMTYKRIHKSCGTFNLVVDDDEISVRCLVMVLTFVFSVATSYEIVASCVLTVELRLLTAD